MRVIVPPIKCQGIKTKLVPLILELTDSSFERWIEPFMGSGVVGFNKRPVKALFSDSNPHIISFYKAIKSGHITASVVRKYLESEGALLRTADDNGYAHYRFIRDRFNEHYQPLDFLFLSRAGFNGMIRFSKKGKWNIPFCKKPERFSKSYVTKIVNQIDSCARLIQNEWDFYCQDYVESILSAKEGDMIYCDPPYLGRYTDYYNNWTEADEERLAEALKPTRARFVLSSWHHNTFRQNITIEKYWSAFNIVTRDHFYHSGAKEENRNPVVECLIFNFDCSSIKKHNHDLKARPKQLPLFASIESCK